jgi:hypothetical protein
MRKPLALQLIASIALAAGCAAQPAPPVQPRPSPTAAVILEAGAVAPEPQPAVVLAWDFAASQEALGWQPAHGLAAFAFDAEGLRASVVGGDPYMVGPSISLPAADAAYVEVRMRSTNGSDAQLFWEVGGTSFNEPASLHFEVNPDGDWHTYRVPVKASPNWKDTITRLRLDPTSQSSGDLVIGHIRAIGPLPAQVLVRRFGPASAFATAGQPFDAQAIVENAGDQPADDAEYRLVLPDGLSAGQGGAAMRTGALAPGQVATLTWSLAGPAGVYTLGLEQADLETAVVVEQSTPPADAAVLAGSRIRLTFPRQPFGYGAGTVEWSDGQAWRVAGRLRSLGEVAYADGAGRPHAALLYAQTVVTSENALQFDASFVDADGATWTLRVTFLAMPAPAFISVTHQLSVDAGARLLAWSGLEYLPGEGGGSFGAARDSALFPGLEYLLADDISSSDRYVAQPLNRRFVPHANKITIPLMAVTRGGLTTGLMWDATQRWDGAHDRPAALFASPNTWDGQPNHLMRLFAPGMTAGLPENAARLSQPYALAADTPLQLSALLFADAALDPLRPVELWLQTYGLPEPLGLPRATTETLRLALANYRDVVWVPASNGWRYALQDPWGPGYNPGIALHLWLATMDSELKGGVEPAWRDTARAAQASPAVGGQPNPWFYQPIFLLNQAEPGAAGLQETLARLVTWRQGADAAMAGQRDDGTWGYSQTNTASPQFGAEGDTSNGYTATRAFHILYAARITGDAQLAAAGLKALRYFEQQPLRPEGAQTWELSLHVPDVLASAWVVQSFVEGYRLTGERRYLDLAQRWALAGLPFIYLWNPDDRPVMRFGSIPVFGATNYTFPWFGRPVMWNGLDYAFGLQALAGELRAAGLPELTDWRAVAEGITGVTTQMQSLDQAYLGMYPDAWDVMAGSEAYTWWLAPTYLAHNLLLLRGAPGARVTTRAVDLDGRTARVSAAADILSIESQPDALTARLRYYAGESSAVLVSGLAAPPASVRVNGRLLDPGEWQYGQGWLVARVAYDAGEEAEVAIAWKE